MNFESRKRGRGHARPIETVPKDKSYSSLETMLNHVAQGIAMFDADHRLTGWNVQLQELLALPDTLLSDAPGFEQFIGFLAERGDFGPSSASLDAAVRALTTSLNDSYIAERMLPDGRILECRRDPLPDGGLIVMYTDVSEQRHADYLVQDSERQIRTILDKAPVALAVIGQEDGRLKHVNARFRKLFGLADLTHPDEIDLSQHVSSEDRDRILDAKSGAPSADFESAVRCIDGSEFWALVAPVRFVFEWAPAVLTGFYDVSDRRRAEAGLREELKRKQAELGEARTLQLELAPSGLRSSIGNHAISIDVVLEPAREVGGDLVDHFQIDDSLLVLALGDVSHKGAGAALFMARTHSLIRGIAARPDAADLFRDPAGAVRLINAALSRNNATGMFVTLLLATFDAESGRLAYVRAGHLHPFLRRASGTIERLRELGGPPLGLADNASYKSASVDLRSGDQLLTLTDGITEAADLSGAQFGEGRVEEFLSTVHPDEVAPLTRLIAAVRKFEAGQPALDDIATLLLAISARPEQIPSDQA